MGKKGLNPDYTGREGVSITTRPDFFPAEPDQPFNHFWRQIEVRESMTFNHVSVNYYRNGADNVGMHADDGLNLATTRG